MSAPFKDAFALWALWTESNVSRSQGNHKQPLFTNTYISAKIYSAIKLTKQTEDFLQLSKRVNITVHKSGLKKLSSFVACKGYSTMACTPFFLKITILCTGPQLLQIVYRTSWGKKGIQTPSQFSLEHETLSSQDSWKHHVAVGI